MDAKLSFNVAAWQEGKTALDIAKGRENNTDMVRRIEASTEGTDAHHTPTLRTPTLPCPYIRYYPYSSAPTLPLPYSWVVCTTRTPARACLRERTRGNGVLPLPLPTG